MNTTVTFLARQRGAIGIFHQVQRVLDLPLNPSPSDIIDMVCNELEVNAILSIQHETDETKEE